MGKEHARAAFFLLILAMAAQSAFASDAEAVVAGTRLLEQATEGFFGETLAPQAVRALLAASRADFDGLADRCDRLYWQARVEVILGFVEQSEGSKRGADARFAHAQDLAREAVACRETSDGYRVLADTYGQLIVLRGVFYAVANGRRMMQLCEKAIALDARNFDARLTLAIAQLHTPAIAGGGVARSMAQLQILDALPALTRLQQFSIDIWVAIALDKKGDRDAARARLERASALYPLNSWVRKLLEQQQGR